VQCFRKDLSLAQREWKKRKSQKKAQRLKQMEDEREQDKNKWLQFNSKVSKQAEFLLLWFGYIVVCSI